MSFGARVLFAGAVVTVATLVWAIDGLMASLVGAIDDLLLLSSEVLVLAALVASFGDMVAVLPSTRELVLGLPAVEALLAFGPDATLGASDWAFNRGLDRVRREEAFVADRRDLGV